VPIWAATGGGIRIPIAKDMWADGIPVVEIRE
jgi:hypothetical protein